MAWKRPRWCGEETTKVLWQLRSLGSRTAKGRVLSPDPDDPALARSEGEDQSEDHQVHLCTGTAWARASRCRQSVNYQVVAVHRSAEADKLLEELRKKGFPHSSSRPRK